MKEYKKEKKEIIILNILGIGIGVIPIVGLAVIPLLFLINLILGIIKFKKNREISILFFICAVLAPLIGTSICSYVYSGMDMH